MSYRSESRIETMREEFLIARAMHELQEEIAKMFNNNEKVVHKEVSIDRIESLEKSLTSFKIQNHLLQ